MSRRTSQLLVALACVLVAASFAAAYVLDLADPVPGGGSSATDVATAVVLVVALAVNVTVGAVVALARRSNPVGWLFLLLGLVMALEAPTDEYVQYGAGLVGTLPGARAVVVVTSASWILWFTLVALVLLLTPTGRALTPRWRLLARVQTGAGLAAFALALPSAKPLDPPYQRRREPDAGRGGPAVGRPARHGLRLRHRAGPGRPAAPRWCCASAGRAVTTGASCCGSSSPSAPLPLYVVVAFVSSHDGADVVTLLATGGFVTLIPVAAGLSVLRYRLYDVERIVSTSITWVLLSTVLVATYACVVWLGARARAERPGLAGAVRHRRRRGGRRPRLPAAQRGLQDVVDRRFNRRAYDARRRDRRSTGRRGGRRSTSRRCSARRSQDPGLTRRLPRRLMGRRARRRTAQVDVDRHGRVVARIAFDPDRNGRRHRPAGGGLAAAELDNARLRAELGRQVEEIAASRAPARRRAARGAAPDRAGPARRRPAVPARARPSSCSRPSSTATRSGCGRRWRPGRRPRAPPCGSCASWRTGCTRPRSPTAAGGGAGRPGPALPGAAAGPVADGAAGRRDRVHRVDWSSARRSSTPRSTRAPT